jgi:hypothetical protein
MNRAGYGICGSSSMKKGLVFIGALAAFGFGPSAMTQAPGAKDIVTAFGEVTGTTQIRTREGDHRDLVKLQRSDGGVVVVDLGPAAARVQRGERLFVQGHSARISGKPVIFARYLGQAREIQRNGTAGAAAGASTAQGEWRYDDFGPFRDELEWTSDDPAFLSFYSDAENAWDAYRGRTGGEGSGPVRR